MREGRGNENMSEKKQSAKRMREHIYQLDPLIARHEMSCTLAPLYKLDTLIARFELVRKLSSLNELDPLIARLRFIRRLSA